ncbi:MAG TPA: DUF3089 domain-containing protein [Candidatus Angelobacter sp.]|nr:DUF3089 domain-containing protein [Candidatus Angelobacter sp.]
MTVKLASLFAILCLAGSLAHAFAHLPTGADKNSNLPAPDYSHADAWLAQPGDSGNAEHTPAGVLPGESSQRDKVDVFFIHPTTYLAPTKGNARYDERGEVESRLQHGVLRFQASVFNGCCRIFAPHYRQASLAAITKSDAESVAATDLAYSDVARAFDYYIAHRNQGRPFIVASHSQGSTHAMRLLQEKILHTPLAQRMIAAYVIGSSLPQAIAQQGLPICQSESATGCVIDWNTVKAGHIDERRKQDAVIWWDGRYQTIAGRPIVCVNPLNWKANGSAEASANLGSIYSDGPEASIPEPLAHVTGASCDNDLLGVDIPFRDRRHFADALTIIGVYHDFDYNLFYMNIRQNVAVRIAHYMAEAHR